MILLTPASVVYFCQFILTVLVAVYLLWRSFQPVENRLQMRLAAGVFAVTTLLLASLWVEVTSLGPWRDYARFFIGLVLTVQGIFVFLFLYHVPEWDPRDKREVWVVMAFLVLVRLPFEIYVFFQRFQDFAATGIASRSRPVISDILLVAVVFWLIIVAFRRLRRLERRSAVFLIELFVLCLLLLMMAAVQLSFSIGWISPSMSQIVQSLGTMFILPLFALIMFDLLTDPLMLLARLVGVVLVVTLFLVGGISWLLALPFLNISLNAVSSTANAPLWRLPMDAQGMIEMTQVLVYPETFQWLKPGAGPALSPDITAQAQADYLAVRRMLHTPMLLLTLAAAFTTVWVIAAVPLLLRWSLFSPLEALLAGVRQVNAGRLDVDVPVHLHDELGQVTEAFNRMVAELRDMVATLEARVAERTAELSRSEERFRGLVEQIDEIIFRVALPDAHLEYISPALERMLGYDVEWAMNNPEFISDVLHPDYVGWYHERLAELAEGKVAPQYEYQVLDSEGRPRWLQQSNVDIVDSDGRLIAIECVSRDVTVNKLAEAQLRMQQSELAALHERERIGRDLHDGLGQVMGYVNVQAQAARSLVEAGQVAQAEAIMAQLAQVAKDAHADIRRYILDLRLPAAEVVTQEWRTALSNYLQTFEQNYGINVHLSYPAGLSPDPFPPAAGKEVFQIIQEALNNVRKHAGVKTAQVILLQADDHITVIVADNGAGFEVGKAGEAASTEARERNFGLKIMCERAEVIGASLQINSAPDAGTQVMVRVPLTRDEAEQPVELSLDEMAVIGLRVLLVDDHPLFLEGMRNMLTARGVQVIGAALDGIEAQELARELQPDVILMDMNMPRCDGLEATALIKAELPQIKIIMLTVAAEQEKLFQALQAGASGYLLKSLDSGEFFQLLAEAMQGEVVLSQGLAEQVLSELARRRSAPTLEEAAETLYPAQSTALLLSLSSRQRDILERTARGSTYKEIASALFISEATVKYHMGQIVELLQVENRREAIALARQAGLGAD